MSHLLIAPGLGRLGAQGVALGTGGAVGFGEGQHGDTSTTSAASR